MGWHQRWWGNGNDEQTINKTNTERSASNNESEDEEEIMTSTPIGPPLESKQELWRLYIGQKIMPGCTIQQTRDAIQLVEENQDDFYEDCALMSAIVTGQNDKPKTFQEAWYHDDQENWKKWRTIIWKEFYNVYCFVNPNTNQMILSRDVKLLSSRYGEEINV